MTRFGWRILAVLAVELGANLWARVKGSDAEDANFVFQERLESENLTVELFVWENIFHHLERIDT